MSTKSCWETCFSRKTCPSWVSIADILSSWSYLHECLNIYVFKSSPCSYVLKEEWMVIDAVHVIFYWFRIEQELGCLIPYMYSTCTGLKLIFYRIGGWKNALISFTVLLLVSWDINHNLGFMGERNKKNFVCKMLYVLKRMVRKIHVRCVCLVYGIRRYFYLKSKYQAFITFMSNINCHHRFSMIFKNLTCMQVFACQSGTLLQTVISFTISDALEIKPQRAYMW